LLIINFLTLPLSGASDTRNHYKYHSRCEVWPQGYPWII